MWDVDELKQRFIKTGRSGIQQSVTDQAIDQWQHRLNVCVKVEGKHHHHFILPKNKNIIFNNITEMQLADRQKNIKFMKLAPMLYTNTTK